MSDMSVFFAVFVIFAIFIAITQRRKSKGEIRVLYLDEGRKTPVLYSSKYELAGKPDAIVRDASGDVAVIEYKSRVKNVYLSDVIQAKASALVARENNYPVKYVLIKTKQSEERVDLPKSNAALYRELTPYVTKVWEARRGKSVPASASRFKCSACGYRYTCKDAVTK